MSSHIHITMAVSTCLARQETITGRDIYRHPRLYKKAACRNHQDGFLTTASAVLHERDEQQGRVRFSLARTGGHRTAYRRRPPLTARSVWCSSPGHWSCNSICFAGLGAFGLPIALHCMKVGSGVSTTEANCGRAERKASADARAKSVASESLNRDAMVLCGGGYCARSFRLGGHSRAADVKDGRLSREAARRLHYPRTSRRPADQAISRSRYRDDRLPANVDNNSRTPWPRYSPPRGPECRDAP